MKSIPWGNAGNFNMRGRKTAYYGDGDNIQNFKERELIKELEKDIDNEKAK